MNAIAEVLTQVVSRPTSHLVTRHLAARLVTVTMSGVAARHARAHGAPTIAVDSSPDASPDTSGERLALVSGAQLRRLRKHAGWTQRELAERLSYSQQQVAAWERGRHRIPASLMPLLLDLLLDAKQQRENLNSLMTSIERWPTVGEW